MRSRSGALSAALRKTNVEESIREPYRSKAPDASGAIQCAEGGRGTKTLRGEIVPHQRNPCRLGSVQNRLSGFVAANGGICHTNRFNRAVEDAKTRKFRPRHGDQNAA